MIPNGCLYDNLEGWAQKRSRTEFSFFATWWLHNVVKILKYDFLETELLENFENFVTH